VVLQVKPPVTLAQGRTCLQRLVAMPDHASRHMHVAHDDRKDAVTVAYDITEPAAMPSFFIGVTKDFGIQNMSSQFFFG
jgi:hypothetical protein